MVQVLLISGILTHLIVPLEQLVLVARRVALILRLLQPLEQRTIIALLAAVVVLQLPVLFRSLSLLAEAVVAIAMRLTGLLRV